MTAAEETVVLPAGTGRLGGWAGSPSTTTPRAGQVTVGAGLRRDRQVLAGFAAAGTPSLLMDEPKPPCDGQGPDTSQAIWAAAASTTPPGLTATGLAARYALSRLGPPLTRPSLM